MSSVSNGIGPEGGQPLVNGGQQQPLCPCSTAVCTVTVVSSVFVILVSICLADAIHKVNEGNVGVYYRQGALLLDITDPGVHHHLPFLTSMVEVTIRPTTYNLQPIRCITRDGIENTFYSISVISSIYRDKVVNLVKTFGSDVKQTLVYDRIGEELRTFCANHSIDEVYNEMFLDVVAYVKRQVETSIDRLGDGGVRILNIAIPKPDIPEDIANNYKLVKVQWTEQLVSTQEQKTERIKKETEKIKALLDEERNKEVLQINLVKQILKKEGEQKIAEIQNNITRSISENKANIEAYAIQKEAEANKQLFTDKFVQLEIAKSMLKSTKFYFSGESSLVGSILTKLAANNNDN